MTGYYFVRVTDKNRICESKAPDAVGILPNLLFGMGARVARIRGKFVYVYIGNGACAGGFVSNIDYLQSP